MTIKQGVLLRRPARGNSRQVAKAVAADAVNAHNAGRRYDAAKDHAKCGSPDDIALWRAERQTSTQY